MDMTSLVETAPFRWQCAKENRAVIFYGDYHLLSEMDQKVYEQISHVATLPGLVGSAMTLPDAHWGYGFPIGAVAAFDPHAGGVISAGGVGFDISCGIRTLRTNLFLADVLPHIDKLTEALFQSVPTGVGQEGKYRLSLSQLDDLLQEGATWAIQKGHGVLEDLNYIEDNGVVFGANPEYVSKHAKERQLGEMGTLGSGNHYLEIQVVQSIFDSETALAYGLSENQIIISIHCGSRGLGHQIGSDYLIDLAKAAKRLGLVLPDRELAFAPILSDEGQAYIAAMNSGINCALANRQMIAHQARVAVNSILPHAVLETLFDVSHNTCKREIHLINGEEKEVYVHRKGATRAFGPLHPSLPLQYQSVGQPVCIGGSMGTSSYILAGNPSDKNLAFASACHGAGRRMSRRQALKKWHGRELLRELALQGILIRSNSMRGIAEEAPDSYKDVNKVVEVTELSGLARRVALLKPLACIKG